MVIAEAELTPGTTVDRRYRIQRILGRGGFGRTYLAADERRFGELCVLKEFVSNAQADPVMAQKLRELFQREAAILHQLDHPQIPKFFAGFEENGRLFIAQQYINGQTYWRLLQERQRQGHTFNQREIIEWLQHLLRVLDYLHTRNIVHRDISPDNIMLPQGQTVPVLIDFGVVKQVIPHLPVANSNDPDDLIQASVSVGKFGYAPYEQIRMGQCSPRSDLYALAVTAVVLLTGKTPNLLIDAKSLEWQWKRRLRLDARLSKILETMMAEKPQDRYPSAQAVLQALQPLCESLDLFETSAVINQTVTPSIYPEVSCIPSSQVQDFAPDWVTQATAVTGQLMATQVDQAPSTSAIYPVKPRKPPIPTQLEGVIVPVQSQQLVWSAAASPVTPQPLTLRSVVSLIRAAVFQFPRDQMGNAKRPIRLSLKQTLALGLLAILPIGGAMIGARLPYVSSLCVVLENCVSDQNFAAQYRQAIDQANSAGVLSDQAHTLKDLQYAREQLATSIAQLNAFSGNPEIMTAAHTILPRYQELLATIDGTLATETRAAQLLSRAEAEAQKATEQSKIAKTAQQYQVAQLQWRRALATLAAIPGDTLANAEAKTRSQEYTTRLEAVSVKLQAMLPKVKTAVNQPARPAPSPVAVQQIPLIADTAPAEVRPAPSQAAPSARPAPSAQPARPSATPARSTRLPTPVPSSVVAAYPQSSNRSLEIDRRWVAGSLVTSASQTLKDVSIWLEGKRAEADGRFTATLTIQNRSGRGFGFVPLYAESRDGQGNTVRSRVLFTGTADTMLEPGEFLTAQIYLLDRPDPAISQRFTLVIQESTSGERTFRIPL